MSLATRCTECGTVFRVVEDQLKVSEGWVRCGRCSAVFNALENLCEIEADPVYRLLGAGGLAATNMPPTGQLVASRLGYFIRPGKHAMNRSDWTVFLDFADTHFRGKAPGKAK